MKALEQFHPAVRDWFLERFPAPTAPQAEAWPAIKAGKHTLIAAPTGSGKTLAAFLSAIDDLVWKAIDGTLTDETQVVYVSPLKALSNDIKLNLEEPLKGIQANLEAAGVKGVEIRTLVRTGDTPAKERVAMTKKPPHIVVTTPESLYILLTSDGGRKMLSTVRTLIVDEIHAMVDDKRGSHLSLSIERLEALVHSHPQTQPPISDSKLQIQESQISDSKFEIQEPLVRVGLSATQKPIEEVARFLVGTHNIEPDESPRCTIIDTGHVRKLDLAIEVPNSPLESLMSNEVWEEIYDRLAQMIRQHKTTLVFVNTRRMAERVARHLGERLGDENVTSHHGSLAREIRLAAEQRLKSGELSALVATASLELGIDIGAVDLVVQIGSTRAISTLLQRIGRSNHTVTGFPKGRIFPLSRDELVECAALIDSVRRGELDHLEIPEQPLDILAQQIVAAAAPEEWKEDDLFAMVRRAYPYRNLKREKFDEVIRMLSEGFTTRRGRRGTYLHHDAVNQRIRGRRGARLMSITNGGAIPDTGDYRVILEPSETFVGTLNEDFAIESLAGDIFQLGNSSYEIKRVGAGEVRVLDAHGQPPSIPFWLGEAPGRSEELSESVSRLRKEIAKRLDEADDSNDAPRGPALAWLENEVGIIQAAAEQIVEYLAMTKIALGAMPTQEQIVVERFFDENGSTHVVIHAPFGSRLNRAWGLALRKRFCRAFNFELQAAATEDSIVLSLGPTHSFPLETIFNYLNSKGVCDVLVQALLNAPMFNIRWRWNATRALAIPRWRSGGKVAPQLQRMAAEDLLALVFPDQLACAENLSGPIEVPAHPLVEQTVRDCLEEAMDIHGLERLLESIERGERTLIAREMNEPSPLAQEILTAKPYAFLDDAPAEERRTLAVMNRRFLDAETAADLGRLDQAAIDRVREEAWPSAENADELHDALMQLGFITAEEGAKNDWVGLFDELVSDRRATVLKPTPQPQRERRNAQSDAEYSAPSATTSASSAVNVWVAAERLNQLRVVYPNAELNPQIEPPASYAHEAWVAESALVEVLRGRLDALGPVTVAQLANSFSLSTNQIEIGLAKLEGEGFAMQGQFTPTSGDPTVREGANSAGRHADDSRLVEAGMPALVGIEWCSRRLLARIHSYTLNRLRKEIEPVSSADFMRFLLVWQKVASDHKTEGAASVTAILDQLEGFEAPAGSWESEILPARINDYDPAWLDALCLSGRLTWLRLSPPKISPEKSSNSSPVRSTPVVLLNRKNVATWSLAFPAREKGTNLSTNTQTVYDYLKEHGASFFVDIVSSTNLLPSMVEEALGELVFRGLITADSFTGLRALLTPLSKTTSRAIENRRRRRKPIYSMDEAGRWVILQKEKRGQASFQTAQTAEKEIPQTEAIDRESIEAIAQKLLQRYGVVFRKLLDRESINIPWRDLLRVLRRLEARGEIRGGRFVGGFTGEQFATADAVHLLRSMRRTQPDGTMLSVSAADPLNMLGILVPGPRLAPAAANRLLYRDGVPIAVLEAKEIRYLVEMEVAEQWQARNALLRRRIPPKVRAYLNQSGSTTSPTTISRLTH